MGIETEIEEPSGLERDLLSETKPQLYALPPEPQVTLGTHSASRLSLFKLHYEGNPESTIFIYPSNYFLTRKRIEELNPNFSSSELRMSKAFTEKSIEEVSRAFLMNLGSLKPLRSVEYRMHQPQIVQHSFPVGAEVLLADIVKDINF